MSYDFNNKTPKQVAEHYGLKPCPFCGGPAHFKRKHQRISCEACQFSMSHHWMSEYYTSDAIAYVIEKWNRRTGTASAHKAGQEAMRERAAVICHERGGFEAEAYNAFERGHEHACAHCRDDIRRLPIEEPQS